MHAALGLRSLTGSRTGKWFNVLNSTFSVQSMLGYRRKSFRAAHSFLAELRAEPSNFDALWSLQRLLIREIRRVEERIRASKKELKSLELVSSDKGSERRISYLINRVERLRSLNFVWKCFGDAVAFLYMDKFALKQTYYSTYGSSPKQDAGFLTDKEGFEAELALLEKALADGFPALLVDLTNTIRHGDVCLMIGPDPHLVEVKTGRKLDKRGKKQAKSIEQLHDFFESDVAHGLRGMREIYRVEYQGSDQSYAIEINNCIEKAYETGSALINPETGLYFLAITDDQPLGKLFQQIDVRRPWVLYLNQFKANRNWMPYYPFSLTIRTERHLYDFFRGELHLLTVIDVEALRDLAAEKGFIANFDPSDLDTPFKLTKPGITGRAGISAHLLKRIGLEFTSPRWIVDGVIEGFRRNIRGVQDGAAQ
ncbi:hypothetical protein ACD578_07915 [Microvirga sp. RSM25]|uniref:hypothetical protein n=1 Tax=Microvirga sp. RSM25 TaxID=3273802 RepID=UPI00384EE52E